MSEKTQADAAAEALEVVRDAMRALGAARRKLEAVAAPGQLELELAEAGAGER